MTRRVVVLAGESSPTVKRYLSRGGRAKASGAARDPFGTWGELVDGLRAIYVGGGRSVVVRIIGDPPALDHDNRARIAELERLGLRAQFLALELQPQRPNTKRGPS